MSFRSDLQEDQDECMKTIHKEVLEAHGEKANETE